MAATGYLDACGFNPTSSGTGDFVVSSAIAGYRTPASAGAVNGTVYSYRAQSSDLSQWENGFGPYTSGTTTLARATVLASSTGSKVSFSAAPNVYITALSADLQNAGLLANGTVPTPRLGSGTANGSTFLAGDQTFKVVPQRVLLNTLTISSGATTVTDDTDFGVFNNYEIHLANVTTSAAVSIRSQFRVSGVNQTSGYLSHQLRHGIVGVVSQDSTTEMILCFQNSNIGSGFNGTMNLRNLGNSLSKYMQGQGQESALANGSIYSSTWVSASVVTGIKFYPASGTFGGGTIQVYGLS